MLKTVFIACFFCVFNNSAFSQDTIASLNYETEDYLCEIGIEMDSCNHIPLYNEIYHWLNIPYKYAGNSVNGIDCSGLIKNIYKLVYNIKLTGGSVNIYQQSAPIKNISDLVEGDLVFFKIRKSQISHVGLFLKDGYFLHASVRKGVMISNINETYYQKYYFSGSRIN